MSDPAENTNNEGTELNETAQAVEGENLAIDLAIKAYLDDALARQAGDILNRIDQRIDEAHRVFDERMSDLEKAFDALDPAALSGQIEALGKLAGDLEASGLVALEERVRAVEQRITHFV